MLTVIGKARGGRWGRLAVPALAWALVGATLAKGPAFAQEPEGEAGQESPVVEAPAVAPEAAPVSTAPTSTAPTSSPRYREADDLEALYSSWLGSGLAERIEVGVSAGGRPISGLVFGGSGGRPLADRPTVLLVGALDGVSIAGAEAVLRVTDELLAAPERLPADVAFLAVPWANPDGIARLSKGTGSNGGNDIARDEDRDGASDEDGPDDLDGDGVIASLLIEDPDGPWARADDDRLLRAARPGDAPRYVLAPEGRDDDGDGRFNEDGPGGIVCDLDFPVDWRGPWTGAPTGPWPLYSPEARALADLVLDRRVAIALFFQGAHGGLAGPGGVAVPADLADGAAPVGTPWFAADHVAFEHAGRRFAAATGRPDEPVARLADARGSERPGAALDWLYLARGVFALEVAIWGPGVEVASRARAEGVNARSANARDAAFQPRGGPAGGPAALSGDRRGDELDRAWAAWVDNTRGGIGFLDWQPIELDAERRCWIGGWLPRTRLNPPPELLERVTDGMSDFVRGLAEDVPRLSIEVLELERTGGDVCVLRARVRNLGALPSGVGVVSGALGVTLNLQVPEGAQVLVGERVSELGTLAGFGASEERSWVLLLPESAGATLRVDTPWLGSVAREVRP